MYMCVFVYLGKIFFLKHKMKLKKKKNLIIVPFFNIPGNIDGKLFIALLKH